MDRMRNKIIRGRFWILRHLKKALLDEDYLLAMYKSFVLPIFDFACVVYHPLLTNDQSNELERLTTRRLFSQERNHIGRWVLEENERLTDRRQRLLDTFVIFFGHGALF